MNDELRKRISEKDVWTFKDCLGLASEFSTKTRFVVAMVLEQGKNYVDGDESPIKTSK